MLSDVSTLPPRQRQALRLKVQIERERRKRQADPAHRPPPLWAPNPDLADGRANTQRLAYESTADVIGLSGTAGWGKALSLDTLLPTPVGWTTMGEVSIGDMLFDECGNPCRVIAVSPVMHNHDVYEVRFNDNSTIKADGEHRWLTFTRDERRQLTTLTDKWRAGRREKRPSVSQGWRPDAARSYPTKQIPRKEPPAGTIRTTCDILATLRTADKKKAINHAVKVAAPLQLPQADLPIDPYVLGVWLGDGSSYKAEISTADPEILDEINNLHDTRRRGKYEHGVYGLLADLRKLDLISNKHIPPIYLRASEKQRTALLMGLMDTDGTVDKESGACEFYSTKEKLINDVWELLLSLGIKCNIVTGRATLDGRDCGPKYRIKFSTSRPVFRLGRKLERQIKAERGTQSWRYITAVRKIDSEPVKCVAVDSPNRLYLAGSTMIPTHNTDLLLGMAANKHRHSVIFRRKFKNLRSTIERSRQIFNPGDKDAGKDRFNEQLHRWVFDGGKRLLEFEACQYEHNKFDQRGRPRSLMCFDEATEFSRSIVEFIGGWNRSPDPNQKCQIVLPFNVPTDNAGTWVVDYFLPWIAYLFPHKFTHLNPAAPGELRWYATIDGKETECKDGTPFDHKGERILPKSRTFFFGTLEDNPHYGDDYISTLQSMPEPLRSQLLYGNFAAEAAADPWQVIPTAWVKLAQARWMERERPSMPCSGVGVDVARGGADKLVVARRYGTYFDEVTAVPGVNVEDGPKAAALTGQQLTNESHVGYINVDVVGVGTSAYDSLKAMYPGKVRPINAANASDYIVASKGGPAGEKPGGQPLLKMRNVRAEYYWRMREALDPEHGVDIALPPGNEVVADLCAARWQLQAGGVVQIEPKEKIKERIGRSPDVGEAIMFALAADYGVKGEDKTVNDWVAV